MFIKMTKLHVLLQPVAFSSSIAPICLPSASIYNVTGHTLMDRANGRRVCFVAGWGHTSEGQGKSCKKGVFY